MRDTKREFPLVRTTVIHKFEAFLMFRDLDPRMLTRMRVAVRQGLKLRSLLSDRSLDFSLRNFCG
jgi:hypothetical protein